MNTDTSSTNLLKALLAAQLEPIAEHMSSSVEASHTLGYPATDVFLASLFNTEDFIGMFESSDSKALSICPSFMPTKKPVNQYLTGCVYQQKSLGIASQRYFVFEPEHKSRNAIVMAKAVLMSTAVRAVVHNGHTGCFELWVDANAIPHASREEFSRKIESRGLIHNIGEPNKLFAMPREYFGYGDPKAHSLVALGDMDFLNPKGGW